MSSLPAAGLGSVDGNGNRHADALKYLSTKQRGMCLAFSSCRFTARNGGSASYVALHIERWDSLLSQGPSPNSLRLCSKPSRRARRLNHLLPWQRSQPSNSSGYAFDPAGLLWFVFLATVSVRPTPSSSLLGLDCWIIGLLDHSVSSPMASPRSFPRIV